MSGSVNNQNNDFDEDDDSKIFPQRLMEILADDSNEDAICWLPHGKAFIIRNRNSFAERIMPRFFSRKAKYSSFTRKLNRWNFVRVSSGPELGAYYHEFFLRDKPHLAAQMFCKNARAKLAMANDPISKPAAVVPEQQQQQQRLLSQPMLSPVAAVPAINSNTNVNVIANIPTAINVHSSAQLTPAMLASLQLCKQQDAAKAALLSTLPISNVQLLEHQMQLIEQEQAKRLALQRTLLTPLASSGNGIANHHHQAALQQQLMAAHSQKQAMDANRLLQLQQYMQIRSRQQQNRVPFNFRASAA